MAVPMPIAPAGPNPALAELREALGPVATQADAVEWVRLVARRTTPGMAVLLFLHSGRLLYELFVIEGGEAILPDLLWAACSADEPEVAFLLLVTDRRDQLPADRPDDGPTWQGRAPPPCSTGS